MNQYYYIGTLSIEVVLPIRNNPGLTLDFGTPIGDLDPGRMIRIYILALNEGNMGPAEGSPIDSIYPLLSYFLSSSPISPFLP